MTLPTYGEKRWSPRGALFGPAGCRAFLAAGVMSVAGVALWALGDYRASALPAALECSLPPFEQVMHIARTDGDPDLAARVGLMALRWEPLGDCEERRVQLIRATYSVAVDSALPAVHHRRGDVAEAEKSVQRWYRARWIADTYGIISPERRDPKLLFGEAYDSGRYALARVLWIEAAEPSSVQIPDTRALVKYHATLRNLGAELLHAPEDRWRYQGQSILHTGCQLSQLANIGAESCDDLIRSAGPDPRLWPEPDPDPVLDALRGSAAGRGGS